MTDVNAAHLVLVNVDVVQLILLRATRAAQLLRLFDFAEDADKLDEAAALLRDEIEDNRRYTKMNAFWKVLAVLVLLIIGMIAAPSLAQEVTETPIPVTVTINGQPADATLEPVAGVRAVDAWPLVAILALIVIGVIEAVRSRDFNQLFRRYDEALKRKDARDYGEEKFKQSSLQVQDFILLAEGLFRVLGNANIPGIDRAIDATHDYLGAISDGKPNEPPEPENKGPLMEGLGSRRDYTQPPGTMFGEVKPGEFAG